MVIASNCALSILPLPSLPATKRNRPMSYAEEREVKITNLGFLMGCGAITFSNYEMSLSSPLLFLAVFVFFDFIVVFNPRQETLISSVLKP